MFLVGNVVSSYDENLLEYGSARLPWDRGLQGIKEMAATVHWTILSTVSLLYTRVAHISVRMALEFRYLWYI